MTATYKKSPPKKAKCCCPGRPDRRAGWEGTHVPPHRPLDINHAGGPLVEYVKPIAKDFATTGGVSGRDE